MQRSRLKHLPVADFQMNHQADYLTALWNNACKDFTPRTMQRGDDVVASAWYSAWSDAGSLIMGAVPEPASLGLLAAEMLALLHRRRR